MFSGGLSSYVPFELGDYIRDFNQNLHYLLLENTQVMGYTYDRTFFSSRWKVVCGSRLPIAYCEFKYVYQYIIQPFIQVQIKENIKAPRHWTLWTEFTPHKGPVTRKMFPFNDVNM